MVTISPITRDKIMAATRTHNEIEIHPPHGAKFACSTGSHVFLQFARGQEREVMEWFQKQVLGPIASEMTKYEAMEKKKRDFENSPEAVQAKLREFAPEVAAKLDAIPSTKVDEPKQCGGCGGWSPGEADFCMKCGISATPAQATA